MSFFLEKQVFSKDFLSEHRSCWKVRKSTKSCQNSKIQEIRSDSNRPFSATIGWILAFSSVLESLDLKHSVYSLKTTLWKFHGTVSGPKRSHVFRNFRICENASFAVGTWKTVVLEPRMLLIHADQHSTPCLYDHWWSGVFMWKCKCAQNWKSTMQISEQILKFRNKTAVIESPHGSHIDRNSSYQLFVTTQCLCRCFVWLCEKFCFSMKISEHASWFGLKMKFMVTYMSAPNSRAQSCIDLGALKISGS